MTEESAACDGDDEKDLSKVPRWRRVRVKGRLSAIGEWLRRVRRSKRDVPSFLKELRARAGRPLGSM